ncbi:MAG TPA: hypothetical protein VN452_00705 [Longilinea sp.]|nr:hypothetical protein [Longilinea sp.]
MDKNGYASVTQKSAVNPPKTAANHPSPDPTAENVKAQNATLGRSAKTIMKKRCKADKSAIAEIIRAR